MLDLVYYQGMTMVGAAERMGLPVGTVKSRCFYALENLRLSFGQHYEVWLSDGRRGITAGTFRVGRDGKARCTLATAGRADHFNLVDVTVEEDAPPTTAEKHPVVLLGDI